MTPPTMPTLPIDPLLPRIVERVRDDGALVLVAPPGAGKTTRVPRELLRSGCIDGEILVLQPRRLAARLAAGWVAAEMGERVGGTVGYQVRFEDRTGSDTRLRFITEALLLRRMLSSPRLDGVGAVVFDEFHERHLHADVALALLRQLRASRADLRIVVMSATMAAEPIAEYLGCETLTSEGRRFEVEVEHIDMPDERRLATQVAAAVSRLVREDLDGDVLTFLPGAAEIRRAAEACAPLADRHDLALMPLYGDLPPEQQDAAVRPADKRKVILSTNVAETSVTIDGVVAVIDSGLARIPGHDPWSGLPTLRVLPISQASAAQRAGRAGRTRAGRCLRLYTRHDHDTRRQQEKPEIERLDLAETMLLLATLDQDPAALPWLDAPPAAALEASNDLLTRLGALDHGTVTDEGGRMAALPLHPRQARVVLEAERRDCLRAGCTAAALLSERDIRREREATESGPSDLLALVDLIDALERARFREREARALGINLGAARRVVRARDQLLRLRRGGRRRDGDCDEAVRVAILAGYPDRVARRRVPEEPELLLALGGSARLSRESVVRSGDWMVAVAAEKRERSGGAPWVRLANCIEPDWLLDLFPDRVRDSDELVWNERGLRVERISRVTYESLVIDESRRHDFDRERAAELLREVALAAGAETFADSEALRGLRARADFVREHSGVAAPAFDPEAVLAGMCVGCSSFAELREGDLLAQLRASLGGIGRLAPERVSLPGGRRLSVHYETDRPPWVESYLQDFFGMRVGPKLVDGRVPLTLHLLAPNRRAVQVTTDLESFWRTHYPSLRKALSRRYPKHDWPEDPASAKPPAPRAGGRKRRR